MAANKSILEGVVEGVCNYFGFDGSSAAGVVKNLGRAGEQYLKAFPDIIGEAMTRADTPAEGLKNVYHNLVDLADFNKGCLEQLNGIAKGKVSMKDLKRCSNLYANLCTFKMKSYR